MVDKVKISDLAALSIPLTNDFLLESSNNGLGSYKVTLSQLNSFLTGSIWQIDVNHNVTLQNVLGKVGIHALPSAYDTYLLKTNDIVIAPLSGTRDAGITVSSATVTGTKGNCTLMFVDAAGDTLPSGISSDRQNHTLSLFNDDITVLEIKNTSSFYSYPNSAPPGTVKLLAIDDTGHISFNTAGEGIWDVDLNNNILPQDDLAKVGIHGALPSDFNLFAAPNNDIVIKPISGSQTAGITLASAQIGSDWGYVGIRAVRNAADTRPSGIEWDTNAQSTTFYNQDVPMIMLLSDDRVVIQDEINLGIHVNPYDYGTLGPYPNQNTITIKPFAGQRNCGITIVPQQVGGHYGDVGIQFIADTSGLVDTGFNYNRELGTFNLYHQGSDSILINGLNRIYFPHYATSPGATANLQINDQGLVFTYRTLFEEASTAIIPTAANDLLLNDSDTFSFFPANSTAYANYTYSVDLNYGSGTLTGTASVAYISNNWLILARDGGAYVTYSATGNFDSPQVGAIKVKYRPAYSGAPNNHYALWSQGTTLGSTQNQLLLSHRWDGGAHIQLTMYDDTNTVIFNQNVGAWSPVSGTVYEFEVDYDITNGATRVFIDGVQLGSTITAIGTRGTINYFQVGRDIEGIVSFSNGDMTDIIGYDTVQHTSNYTSGYSCQFNYMDAFDFQTTNLNITGVGTAVTVAQGDDSTNIATTAYVDAAATSGSFVTPPITPTTTGTKGQWSYDSGYLYKCVATNTWVRNVVATSW